MKTSFLILLFLFVFANTNAQTDISGTITDAATGYSLPAVSIYINNSAIGTSSNNKGEYTLKNITVKRFDLIISCIGYETVSKPLDIENLPKPLNFKLKLRSQNLDMVVVQANEKNGWAKWGQLFVDNLLGLGKGSEKCKILNKDAIKFKFDKASENLSVYAYEPLQIENKYLGYTLSYDLQFFKYDFKLKSIFFLGYPLFTAMQGNEKEMARWRQNRKYAYEGSMMHFMRALYKDKVAEEKFEINEVKRLPNTDKHVQTTSLRSADGSIMVALPDSTDYSGRTLILLDSIDVVDKLVQRNKVTYKVDSNSVALKFAGHLQISYLKEKEMAALDNFHADYVKGKPSSMITLTADKIIVYKNGSYYEPDNIFIEGYWSRTEKLHNLLPINYEE